MENLNLAFGWGINGQAEPPGGVGVRNGNGLTWTIHGLANSEGEDIPVQVDTPTRITIRETTGAEHPFHLHGQCFQVL